MGQGFNGTRQVIDIPANTAAMIAILATGPVRRLVVRESTLTATGAVNALQGLLSYRLPNDTSAGGFSQTMQAVGANTETTQGEVRPAEIVLGDAANALGPWGSVIGVGPQTPGAGSPALAATTLMTIGSGTAVASAVEVTQHY